MRKQVEARKSKIQFKTDFLLSTNDWTGSSLWHGCPLGWSLAGWRGPARGGLDPGMTNALSLRKRYSNIKGINVHPKKVQWENVPIYSRSSWKQNMTWISLVSWLNEIEETTLPTLEYLYRGTTIAPWFCLHLPSCGHGFESQAQHLHFFSIGIIEIVMRKGRK